jgi:uncharacterized protein (TIGR03067 family)
MPTPRSAFRWGGSGVVLVALVGLPVLTGLAELLGVPICGSAGFWFAFPPLAQVQAHAADAVPSPDDRASSAGRWKVVAVEWDGKPVDADLLKLLRVVYQADGSWAVMLRKLPVAEGRSAIHQERSPKTFEMEKLGSDRIPPSRFAGIYRLDGDTSLLCIVREGQPMPTDFTAPKGSDRMLVTLHRVGGP